MSKPRTEEDSRTHEHTGDSLEIPEPFLAVGETAMGYVSVGYIAAERRSAPLNDLQLGYYSTGVKSLL